jgi:CBS domain-containing protein
MRGADVIALIQQGAQECSMKVSEAMSRDPCLVRPQQSIAEAASLMAERDIGALPVGDNDRLVGMITDRDIAIRAIAVGRGPDTVVQDVMSSDVQYCFDDEDLEHVAKNMAAIQVRRLPVVNRDKRLVGIVSLSDLASCVDASRVGKSVAGISTPGGMHSQSTH